MNGLAATSSLELFHDAVDVFPVKACPTPAVSGIVNRRSAIRVLAVMYATRRGLLVLTVVPRVMVAA